MRLQGSRSTVIINNRTEASSQPRSGGRVDRVNDGNDRCLRAKTIEGGLLVVNLQPYDSVCSPEIAQSSKLGIVFAVQPGPEPNSTKGTNKSPGVSINISVERD